MDYLEKIVGDSAEHHKKDVFSWGCEVVKGLCRKTRYILVNLLWCRTEDAAGASSDKTSPGEHLNVVQGKTFRIIS